MSRNLLTKPRVCAPADTASVGLTPWSCGERFVPANFSDTVCSGKTSECWECVEMSVGGKFRLFQDVLESVFWNQEIFACGERKCWVICIDQHAYNLSRYINYIYIKVILPIRKNINKPQKDWLVPFPSVCKQPPLVTHWFVKLGEKETWSMESVCECVRLGGWVVWGCVLWVQRQIDIKLLPRHQWEKDINPPKSCRDRRGQTCGSTSWLITSNHIHAGVLHGRYDLALLDVSLLIHSWQRCLQPKLPPSPPLPPYVQYFCYCLFK